MKFKIIILVYTRSIFVLSIETDPDSLKNILKFGYSINYNYEGQLFHSIYRYYAVAKFHLAKLYDISIIFR